MKDKIIVFTFLIFIFVLLFLNIVIPNGELSISERRYLESAPTFNIKRLLDGRYFKDLDNYLVDNFVFRDLFRKINVFYNFNIINKSDYKSYYERDNYIFKKEKLNEESVKLFTKKMNNIYEKYLTNSNVYYSIIPDKSYYLDGLDNSNYEEILKSVSCGINKNILNIDISDDLDLDSYYYSDIHWKQEKLDRVVKKFTNVLGVSSFNDYRYNYYKNFYGSYYGSVAGMGKVDMISYITNSTIDDLYVYDIEDRVKSIYTLDLVKFDGYDLFLGGATPLITIKNKNCDSLKKLVIFRDSFGSSIAPLLTKGYSSVTLIDLRYISSDMIGDMVDFNNCDVLLLYNTSIINNSDIIK